MRLPAYFLAVRPWVRPVISIKLAPSFGVARIVTLQSSNPGTVLTTRPSGAITAHSPGLITERFLSRPTGGGICDLIWSTREQSRTTSCSAADKRDLTLNCQARGIGAFTDCRCSNCGLSWSVESSPLCTFAHSLLQRRSGFSAGGTEEFGGCWCESSASLPAEEFLWLPPTALQPLLPAEEQIWADRRNSHQRNRQGIAPVPIELRHRLEVHAVDRGNDGRWHEDDCDHRKRS